MHHAPASMRAMATFAVLVIWLAVPIQVSASNAAAPPVPASTQPAPAAVQAVTGDGAVLRVRTAHDSLQERQAIEQLRRILSQHALAPWIGTHEVMVESGAIPHSHPVLTLDTSYLDDDTGQLASFVHEQFHWYLDATASRRKAVDQAIAEFSRLFPDAPDKGPEGARGRESTLLHLIVCDMELHAMIGLVGPEQARRELAGKHFYRWIYRQVLENPQIARVTAKYGLVVPDDPQPATGRRAAVPASTPAMAGDRR